MSKSSRPSIQLFDLLSDEARYFPERLYKKMHAAGPIVRSKLPLIGKVWMFTTYDACVKLLRDHDRFARDSRRAGRKFVADFLRFMPRGVRSLSKNMISVDGDEHTRLRSLVEQAFRKQTIEVMRPRLIEICDRFLDELPAHADADGVVNLETHFARVYPLEVISELLGLPEGDRPDFARLGQRLSSVRSLMSLLSAFPSLWNLKTYLQTQIAKCRAKPRPGLLGAMIQAEAAGDRLTTEELLSMSFLLLLAGHETTSQLIVTTIGTLLVAPDQLQILKNDWSLATSAVEEILRYVSPIQISKPRMCTADFEYHGQQMKRGEYAIAMIGAANHDPAQFTEPDRFDLTRDPNPHLSFGSGIHTCLGLKLARAEAEIALERLVTRYPNISIQSPTGQLNWSGRIGMRTLDSLPVQIEL